MRHRAQQISAVNSRLPNQAVWHVFKASQLAIPYLPQGCNSQISHNRKGLRGGTVYVNPWRGNGAQINSSPNLILWGNDAMALIAVNMG